MSWAIGVAIYLVLAYPVAITTGALIRHRARQQLQPAPVRRGRT
jgi:hypothetical protein